MADEAERQASAALDEDDLFNVAIRHHVAVPLVHAEQIPIPGCASIRRVCGIEQLGADAGEDAMLDDVAEDVRAGNGGTEEAEIGDLEIGVA